jgi:hypothetical protein
VYDDNRPCAVCGSPVRLEAREVEDPSDQDGPVGPADGLVGTADPTVDVRVCTRTPSHEA